MPQTLRGTGRAASARTHGAANAIGYPLIIAAIVAVGVALVLSSSFSGGQYAVAIGKITAAPASFDGKRLRVVGRIKHGSARQSVAGGRPETLFTVIDDLGHELSVVYPQSPPDAFVEGRQCIVEGTLTGTTIDAAKLTVKCPSKYQTEDGLVDRSPEYYQQKYGQPSPAGGPSS